MYDMEFGLFFSVNNCFQSIILARVLIRDEKVETFQWIFAELIMIMSGTAPQTILTDQNWSMEAAIQNVMPDTTHQCWEWRTRRWRGLPQVGRRQFTKVV